MLNMEFFAVRSDFGHAVELAARVRRESVRGTIYAVATSIVLEELTEKNEGAALGPMARLTVESAQQLMDELWRCGLRPSEGTGSAGALRATERHLEDMRKLVFDAQR